MECLWIGFAADWSRPRGSIRRLPNDDVPRLQVVPAARSHNPRIGRVLAGTSSAEDLFSLPRQRPQLQIVLDAGRWAGERYGTRSVHGRELHGRTFWSAQIPGSQDVNAFARMSNVREVDVIVRRAAFIRQDKLWFQGACMPQRDLLGALSATGRNRDHAARSERVESVAFLSRRNLDVERARGAAEMKKKSSTPWRPLP